MQYLPDFATVSVPIDTMSAVLYITTRECSCITNKEWACEPHCTGREVSFWDTWHSYARDPVHRPTYTRIYTHTHITCVPMCINVCLCMLLHMCLCLRELCFLFLTAHFWINVLLFVEKPDPEASKDGIQLWFENFNRILFFFFFFYTSSRFLFCLFLLLPPTGVSEQERCLPRHICNQRSRLVGRTSNPYWASKTGKPLLI